MTAIRVPRFKAGLGGAAVKGGLVVVKAVKIVLFATSAAVYTLLFNWKFAVLLLGMLVVHEYAHVVAMKHAGMKVKGMFFIPMLGAAAVPEGDFKTRADEASIAMAGPFAGLCLAALALITYAATGSAFWAAVAGWWALINVFNLLPVVPLDGGRVLKSATLSIHKWVGLAFGVLFVGLGVWLAVTFSLWIFVIILPLGVLDFFGDWAFEHRYLPRKRRQMRAKLMAIDYPDGSAMTVYNESEEYRRDIEEAVMRVYPDVKPKPPMTPVQNGLTVARYIVLTGLLIAVIYTVSKVPGAGTALQSLQG